MNGSISFDGTGGILIEQSLLNLQRFTPGPYVYWPSAFSAILNFVDCGDGGVTVLPADSRLRLCTDSADPISYVGRAGGRPASGLENRLDMGVIRSQWSTVHQCDCARKRGQWNFGL